MVREILRVSVDFIGSEDYYNQQANVMVFKTSETTADVFGTKFALISWLEANDYDDLDDLEISYPQLFV